MRKKSQTYYFKLEYSNANKYLFKNTHEKVIFLCNTSETPWVSDLDFHHSRPGPAGMLICLNQTWVHLRASARSQIWYQTGVGPAELSVDFAQDLVEATRSAQFTRNYWNKPPGRNENIWENRNWQNPIHLICNLTVSILDLKEDRKKTGIRHNKKPAVLWIRLQILKYSWIWHVERCRRQTNIFL